MDVIPVFFIEIVVFELDSYEFVDFVDRVELSFAGDMSRGRENQPFPLFADAFVLCFKPSDFRFCEIIRFGALVPSDICFLFGDGFFLSVVYVVRYGISRSFWVGFWGDNCHGEELFDVWSHRVGDRLVRDAFDLWGE